MRRVLVIGQATPLGELLIAELDRAKGVESVGIELDEPASDRSGTARSPLDHGELVSRIEEREVDTVVHVDLVPDRSGRSSEPSGADVIGAMRLCAAVSEPSLPVRSLVLASSSAVYPTGSYTPLLRSEASDTEKNESALGASVLEVEDYARDVAERAPHLCVAILRLAELAGPDIRGPLASLLARPRLPDLVGYDPPLQLLHVEDAVRALAFAADVELAGVYNVASEGSLHWSEVKRALGRPLLPLPPVEPGPLQPLARAAGIPLVPNGLLGVLKYGCAMDTTKLAAAGFTPHFDQAACLAAIDPAFR